MKMGPKLMFLGEHADREAWARLELFERRPDEIGYLSVDLSTDRMASEDTTNNLPITMYLFDLVAKKKT
jgi:hypothetical protein